MKLRSLILLSLITVFCVTPAIALMEFFGSGPMSTSSGFPEELKALFNDKTRVAGSIGPIVECKGYYAGDTARLNAFLEAYAKVPDTRLQVILHAGNYQFNMKQITQNNDADKMVNIDWTLTCMESMPDHNPGDFQGKKIYSYIDIWLGGQIDLKKLDVPVTLELRSGGEIEGFIKKHAEKQPTTKK